MTSSPKPLMGIGHSQHEWLLGGPLYISRNDSNWLHGVKNRFTKCNFQRFQKFKGPEL